jgi:hypothetical protein
MALQSEAFRPLSSTETAPLTVLGTLVLAAWVGLLIGARTRRRPLQHGDKFRREGVGKLLGIPGAPRLSSGEALAALGAADPQRRLQAAASIPGADVVPVLIALAEDPAVDRDVARQAVFQLRERAKAGQLTRAACDQLLVECFKADDRAVLRAAVELAHAGALVDHTSRVLSIPSARRWPLAAGSLVGLDAAAEGNLALAVAEFLEELAPEEVAIVELARQTKKTLHDVTAVETERRRTHAGSIMFADDRAGGLATTEGPGQLAVTPPDRQG